MDAWKVQIDCQVHDGVELIGSGVARYRIRHVMDEGVANAIDAIRKLVYEERKVSMEQQLAALRANWEGREMMHYFVERTRHHARRYPGVIFPAPISPARHLR